MLSRGFGTVSAPTEFQITERQTQDYDTKMRFTKIVLLIPFLCAVSACTTLAGKEEVGAVIARRAEVRSSTAVVAADLKEVVRGDELDILDSATVPDTGERWLHVRTRDAEPIEGWIEARNVISHDMIERSKKLAQEDGDLPAQASGQLRASTNIRFTPDRSGNDNILMKLESGARFDIVSWKRVPRPKSADASEGDDVPKAGAVEPGAARRKKEEQKEPEEATELWYKVRLPPSTSPAPAGWVLGKQVELTVPSDIIFYRTGREFVAWHRLDTDEQPGQASVPKDKDAAKDSRPGSWVILEKSSTEDPNGGEPSDFDRIYVLGYDKDRQEHYTAYRSADLKGYLPLRVEGKGDSKTFSVRVMSDGQLRELKFRAYINEKGLLKVEPLNDVPKGGKTK
jgi:hypothetical protein